MKTRLRRHISRHQIFYASIRPAAVLILLLIAALTAEIYLH
ncbi:hypothetical protein [Erwinia sp. E602]|nr:hypothetical protein [Erwinia sp. E602]